MPNDAKLGLVVGVGLVVVIAVVFFRREPVQADPAAGPAAAAVTSPAPAARTVPPNQLRAVPLEPTASRGARDEGSRVRGQRRAESTEYRVPSTEY